MIPIYRAFSETFDKYILGVPYFSDGRYYMLVDDCNKNYDIGTGSFPIDVSTLSIHFPNMLDSQGNKIFASLSKDGKGGDMTNKGICLYEPKYNQFRIIVNLETRTWLEITREDLESYPVKVIGIQE